MGLLALVGKRAGEAPALAGWPPLSREEFVLLFDEGGSPLAQGGVYHCGGVDLVPEHLAFTVQLARTAARHGRCDGLSQQRSSGLKGASRLSVAALREAKGFHT